MNAVPINKAFRPLYTSKKRYFLITGGRGSLKSTTVHDFVARLTYEKGHGILFTRYTMTSAEKSIIPEFEVALDRLGVRHHFHITKTAAVNKKTGSFILFSGIKTSSGDQTANLKSISGITTWIIEEGEDFKDEKSFEDIQQSIRATHLQNRIIWIQNPTTREHFIYKKFIEKSNIQRNVYGYNVTVSNSPNVEHIHTTYHIADKLGYLDKTWVREAENHRQLAEIAEAAEPGAKQKSYYYHNYIGGWLERAEGVIFEKWEEGPFDTTLPYCNGLDWGYTDPLAMTKVAIDQKKKIIYLDQRIYGSGIDDVPAAFKKAGINKKELIVHDTNEPRTAKLCKDAGYNMKVAKKDIIVEDIREMKGYGIIVTPSSVDLKTELNNYTWNDKKAEIPIDLYNHAIDASRYGYRRIAGARKKGVRRRN